MFPKVVVCSLAFTLMVLFLCNVGVSDALHCYMCRNEYFYGEPCGDQFDANKTYSRVCNPTQTYYYSLTYKSWSRRTVTRGCTDNPNHCGVKKNCLVCTGEKCNTEKHVIDFGD